MSFKGTVRRFLENHGNSIEAVVFAMSDTEEVCMAELCLRFPQPFSHNSSLQLLDRKDEKPAVTMEGEDLLIHIKIIWQHHCIILRKSLKCLPTGEPAWTKGILRLQGTDLSQAGS